MDTLLLLLLDSRAPAGAHHHSGMEAAVGTGLVSADPVRGLADLEDFCRARLLTSARVSAAFAAAAGRRQSDCAERPAVPAPAQPRVVPAQEWAQDQWAQDQWAQDQWAQDQWAQDQWAQDQWAQDQWAELDAEFEARTPSEATRAASRQLGGGLLRLLRSVLPDAYLVTPWTLCAGPAPHHPLVLGAGVALAGGSPELVADPAATEVAAWVRAVRSALAPAPP